MTASLSPSEVLKREHLVLLEALRCLRGADQALLGGIDPVSLPFRQLLEYLDRYLRNVHHVHEALFFDLAGRKGGAEWLEVVGQLDADHVQGREFLTELDEALEVLLDGGPAEPGAFAGTVRSFAGWHETHIARENDVVLPALEVLLTDRERRELLGRFEELDRHNSVPALEALEDEGRRLFDAFDPRFLSR